MTFIKFTISVWLTKDRSGSGAEKTMLVTAVAIREKGTVNENRAKRGTMKQNN